MPGCLIVDDEPIAISIIENFLQKYPVLQVRATFTDPLAALTYLQANPVEVLFLDIQMPGLLGTSLLKTIPKPPLTILTTAYANYAVEGFELDVVDYLMKPFAFERFAQAVNKCLEELKRHEPLDFIVVKLDKEYRKIKTADILYFESDGDYLKIHGRADVWMMHLSLRAMEKRLEAAGFVRVHKSFLVNFHHVDGLIGNTLLLGKKEIVVGESYRSKVREYFEGLSH